MPIYRLVGGFPITQATALSLATISGGSIANLYTYTRRYHPNETLKRPLIDYEASLLFCPALLAGTMFGSVFSVMFPPWLTVVLLIALLGYSGKRTLTKGVKRWQGDDKQSPRPTLDDEAALRDVEIDTPLGQSDAGETVAAGRTLATAGTALPPVFFLLTSTPNRADRLPVLLGTMRAQSHPPAGVVLTIPRMPPGARTPQPATADRSATLTRASRAVDRRLCEVQRVVPPARRRAVARAQGAPHRRRRRPAEQGAGSGAGLGSG